MLVISSSLGLSKPMLSGIVVTSRTEAGGGVMSHSFGIDSS